MYGSVASVASAAKMWTNNGSFLDADIYGDGATRPTLTEVETWLEQLSSQMDIVLTNYGFVTPVTESTVLPALDGIISRLCSDLVNAANSSGRFFSEKAIERGLSAWMQAISDLDGWVKQNEEGLEGMGAEKIPGFQSKNAFIFDTI